MDENTAKFLEQLALNPDSLKKLLSSPDGQALMRLLSGNRNSDLQQAAQAASAGNPAIAMKLVQNYLNTPDGASLAKQISRTFRK